MYYIVTLVVVLVQKIFHIHYGTVEKCSKAKAKNDIIEEKHEVATHEKSKPN